MNVKYWSGFSKRKNSTKIPTGGTTATVALKDDTSIMNPTIDSASIPVSANYFYISDFGRYYFVKNVTKVGATRNLFELEEDVLATYKTSIGSYSAFVSRSASYYDTNLHDSAISQSQEYVQDAEGTRTTLTASSVKQGAYIVRTVGYSGVSSFIATEAELYQLLKYAFDQNNWGSGGTWTSFFGDKIAAAYCNPFQFIVDVRWIGLTDTQITSLTGRPSRRVYLGYFDTGLDLHKVDPISSFYPTSLEWQDLSVAVPAAYYNDFRDYDPSWASYEINVPGCGVHPLDPIAIRNGVSIIYGIDSLTGDVIAEVYSGTSDPGRTLLFKATGSVGVSIQIGQVSSQGSAQATLMNPFKSVGDIGRVLASDINRGVAELTGKGSAVVSALTGDKVTTIGSVGSRGSTQLDCDVFITKRLLESKDLQTATAGRPLYQNVTISGLSGFVQCDGASLDIAGFTSEKDAVNGYLNSGFYYE